MYLNDLLARKNISRYRLAKDSGVAQTTVIDICSGKTRIEKCSAETLYKIAKALDVSMESLVESEISVNKSTPRRSSFEIFKSNVCHLVKDKGDIDFIIETLENDEIRKLYDRSWYPEAFYLLAMVDYLSRENDIPICTNYNDIRGQSLQETIYPTSTILLDAAMHTDKYKSKSRTDAIPEFMRFNIVESEVRNVY